MRIDVLSLFPEYFRGPLDESIIMRARTKGLIDIKLVNIRDFSTDRYKKVDDRPFGGGPGMVMLMEPIEKAICEYKDNAAKVIYLSPQGAPLTAKKSKELAKEKHLILLCGHYEGVDERVIETYVDEEISIGDYVLTNGCLAACVLIDSVSRFIPGVIGDEEASIQDSFEKGLLDWPAYTRPEEYKGKKVPEVLLSGNHQEIEAWRMKKALQKTKKNRFDLYCKYLARDSEIEAVKEEIALKSLSLPIKDALKSLQFYKKTLGLNVKAVSKVEFELECKGIKLNFIESEEKSNLQLELLVDFEKFIKLKKSLKDKENLLFEDGKRLIIKDLDGHTWHIVSQ